MRAAETLFNLLVSIVRDLQIVLEGHPEELSELVDGEEPLSVWKRLFFSIDATGLAQYYGL